MRNQTSFLLNGHPTMMMFFHRAPILMTLVLVSLWCGGAVPTDDSVRDYAAHVRALQQRIDPKQFTIIVQPPFVVIGDEPRDVVERRCQTIQWAVDRLKKLYFHRDPEGIIDIWLFRDQQSYEANCEALFHRRPHTPFGFYSPSDRALIMNISTGGGTLIHEIVHPFIAANFPQCPAWFNEGLASLYEQCRDQEGQIQGLTNWRLRGLQAAIADDRLGTLERLFHTTTREFYDDQGGSNYAQARYVCYYLQQQGKLVPFYHRFRANVADDPTGLQTLKKVLEIDDLAAWEKTWREFVMTLTF